MLPTSLPPRASPGARKPHARDPRDYSDRLLAIPFGEDDRRRLVAARVSVHLFGARASLRVLPLADDLEIAALHQPLDGRRAGGLVCDLPALRGTEVEHFVAGKRDADRHAALVPDGFPDSVIQQLPQLRNYAYLKMKDLIVVVDATTRKIVDVFSETQPLT